MHVQILLSDGFDPLDVVAPYEVMQAGAVASGGTIEVTLVSAEGPREAVSGRRAVHATAALDPRLPGVVLVPGAAGGTGGDVTLWDVELNGDRLTRKQSITKPMRLNPAFTMTMEGDILTGTSRAGRLPASTVRGVRCLTDAPANWGR
jgi:hypothetical protein